MKSFECGTKEIPWQFPFDFDVDFFHCDQNMVNIVFVQMIFRYNFRVHTLLWSGNLIQIV